MPRKILSAKRYLVYGPWVVLWGTLLNTSNTLAQSTGTPWSESQSTWSMRELAGFCLDTTLFQKWIHNRDTLDSDSTELFSRMVQPSASGYGHEIHTGGVGYPSTSLWWNPKNGNSESNSMGIFNTYMRQYNTFYFPIIPITRIEFQAGGNNLQIFQLNHHQRIGPSLGAGIQFRNITHNGFLQQSGSKIRNTDMYIVGSLRPGRHFMLASLQVLAADISENGGITSNTLPAASGYNPLNLNIHLRNAASKHQAEIWNLENHWSWRVHQPHSPRMVHRLHKQTLRWQFSDETVANNLAFYPDPSLLIDSTSSRDSLRHSIWTHSLGMEHRNAQGILVQYGVEFSHLHYFSGSAIHSPKNSLPNALRSDLGLMTYGRWEILRKGFWIDWRQGLYHNFLPLMSSLKLGWHALAHNENLHQVIHDSTKVIGHHVRGRFLTSVQLEAYVDPPTYAQRWIKTNSMAWNLPELQSAHGLLLTSEWQPRGHPKDRWILRMGMMRQLIGLGFATTDTFPQQSLSSIPTPHMTNNQEIVAYLGLRSLGTLQTGKIGRLQGAWRYHHLWQWSNSETWVPLPLWACDDWLYIQRRTLAGWTWLAGLAVRYQTPFTAPNYRPELGMWTLGLSDQLGNRTRASGDYPVMDLLAGIRVQKTLLYIRWEHANMGWPANIGQLSSGYPLGNRRLRFGLDWKFLD